MGKGHYSHLSTWLGFYRHHEMPALLGHAALVWAHLRLGAAAKHNLANASYKKLKAT